MNCEASFECLKQVVMKKLTLSLPNYMKQFEVATNISNFAIG